MRTAGIRIVVSASCGALALASLIPGSARAGGHFRSILAVGASGTHLSIPLAQSGPASDTSLFAPGPVASAPRTGYVRLFPVNGGLPGIPGRLYPAQHIVCWSWSERARNCMHLNADARKLLAPASALQVFRTAPPQLLRLVSSSGHVLPKTKLTNLYLAIEAALLLHPAKAATTGYNAIRLRAWWSGPTAGNLPGEVTLTQRWLIANGEAYALLPGAWSFAWNHLNA